MGIAELDVNCSSRQHYLLVPSQLASNPVNFVYDENLSVVKKCACMLWREEGLQDLFLHNPLTSFIHQDLSGLD